LCADDIKLRRFTESVERLTSGFKHNKRLGLAVSGGPDSIALLILASQAYPGRIAAATVDHGLRPEARDEAEFVALLCAERGIAHVILTPSEAITGNIQSAARMARYALLDGWATQTGCDYIATAHHADDQLETILMRLARGSGVDGLSAIRSINGRIIRPLLGFNRAELIAICNDAGVTPVQDPSNDNADFDRVRIRQFLATSPHPFDPTAATHSASALEQASQALDWMVSNLSGRITQAQNNISLDPAALPRELQRRLLLNALKMIDPDIRPRGDSMDRALECLSIGETITLGNILCKGGTIWQLSPAPKRRNG
jgi:tRNA(Ile)-lysidine synthase